MSSRPTSIFSSRLALWLTNGSGALLVVIAFMLLVMTAVAQQEVISRIRENKLPFGYSSALEIHRDARAKQAELELLQRERRALTRRLGDEQVAMQKHRQELEDAWQDFAALLNSVRRSTDCPLAVPPEPDINARAAALNDFRDCESSQGSPAPRSITAAKIKADELDRTARQYRQSLAAAAGTNAKLAAVKDEQELGKLSEQQSSITAMFSDMDVLISSGSGSIVLLPPAMLQILLSFFSGLFGAVLITLVLLVYPKNVVDVSASTQTWGRVFLGGLVALCVYIVLLGGSAVLGSANATSAAGTNYMAFCGIGILAGMFSDRVASWLSERADAFFKRQAQQQQPQRQQTAGRGK